MVVKRVVLLAALLFALAPLKAYASASACVPGTLQDYLNLGLTGCIIDDKLFSDFSYVGSAVGTVPMPASGIAVVPITTAGNPGLKFSAAWSAGSGQSMDSLIDFLVSTTSGAALIKDSSIIQAGSGIIGTGIASVAEQLCLTSGVCSGSMSLFTVQEAGFTKLNDSVVFSPLGQVVAFKDIQVAGGLAGVAVISSVSDQFSELPVPEPTMLSLLGLGLLAIGGKLRRKLA